jgi:RNA polymerase sigma factor (sigma-70 family)
MSPWISLHFLQTQSDERLLAAARDGHERAFEALVHRYRRPLLRHCGRLLLPQAAADDAVQQGLLQAWLALQHGTEVRDTRAWLYRVVHNAAVDALRSSGYDHEQLSDSLQGATAPHSDLERRIAVRQALAGLAALPELQRAALMRTAIEGHSHEEVAAALGLSDGSVRGLVYRARATLRASATAITPTPVVAWLASAGRRTVPLAERLGGSGAGGASAEAGGALLKGGVAMLTAGALVAGTAAVQPQAARRAHHRGPATSAGQRSPGTIGYLGGRAKHNGPGVGTRPAANHSNARDSAHASGLGNVGRAGAGSTSTLFDRTEGSVRIRRLAVSAAPTHQPAHRQGPTFQAVPDGSPQTAANTPSRGTVPETTAGFPTGRSPGSAGFQAVGDASAAARGGQTGEGSGEPRDSPSSDEGSGGWAGSDTAANANGGSRDAGRANMENGNAANAGAGGGDPERGTRGSDPEGGSGGRGAWGPIAHASNAPDSAEAASSGQSDNAGAPPQRGS